MKTTESDSLYNNLEKMPLKEILINMNNEDNKVPEAILKAIDQIESVIKVAVSKMQDGGRLFYIGSGTSGRLGIVDASECPPTYGVTPGMVIGIIAGGDLAIRTAVENAEDDVNAGWLDLEHHNISDKDMVIGLSASGTTPYVVGAMMHCAKNKVVTGCITCNLETPLARETMHPIEVIVGPEFVTGSTRMKAGTAQKLVLNMISTSVMIKLGKVMGNKMVDMQLNNRKLVERGTRMIMTELGIGEEEAQELLMNKGSVRRVIDTYNKS